MAKGYDYDNAHSNQPEYRVVNIARIKSICNRVDYSASVQTGLIKGSAPSGNVSTGAASHGFKAVSDNALISGVRSVGNSSDAEPPGVSHFTKNSGRLVVPSRLGKSPLTGTFHSSSPIHVLKSMRLTEGIKRFSEVAATTAKKNRTAEKINNVWRRHRMKAAAAIYQSGGSAVSALFRLVEKAAVNHTVPVMLAVFLPVVIVSLVFTPLMAVSSFFSGEFSLSFGGSVNTQSIASTLLEEKVYENDATIPGVSAFLDDYISELSAYLYRQQRYYHEVRLFTSKAAGTVGFSESSLAAAFPGASDFVDSIKYVFAAYTIIKFDSYLTDSDFSSLCSEMFESLVSRTEASVVEYCGQSFSYETPLGDSNVCSCGFVHSLSDCPAARHTVHKAYTCSRCCFNDESVSACKNHDPLNNYLCSVGRCSSSSVSASFKCSGSDYCSGHRVLEVYLSFGGAGSLANKYFISPISSLSDRSFLTREESVLLANLQDGYDILQEIMLNAGFVTGSGSDAGEAIARAALALAHENRSQVNAASSWYGSATQAYYQAHQLVWPGDRHAASCCRGVTVSIKYSGADINVSFAGGINNIITGWFLRPNTPWEEVFVTHRDELLPGDILMKHNSRDGSMNHGIVYTGTELMNEYFPGYGDRGYNIAHASYHTRGLAIDNAISETGYGKYRFAPLGCIRVFRCTTQELSTVYTDRPLPPANVVQCMGGCG